VHILLVEDDELLGDSIRLGLIQTKFGVVDWVKNGADAWSIIQTTPFDLVILDIRLPKLSGDEVLRNMRAKNIATPVIILTAYDSIDDRITRLDNGADDYVAKPFNLDELCARIRAMYRRTKYRATNNDPITFDNIKLDPATRLVFNSGQMVDISRREFTFLQLLLENVGKVISREQATKALYGWKGEHDISSNALEVHIHGLRKKLQCKNIRTIRGVGYVLEQ